MRRALLVTFLLVCTASAAVAADDVPTRLSRYFTAWYPICPNTHVTVARVPEIAITGYESYRVERKCDAKNRNEMSVTLVSTSKDEVFVGEVLHSDAPRSGPFSAGKDLPPLEAALREALRGPARARASTPRRPASSCR